MPTVRKRDDYVLGRLFHVCGDAERDAVKDPSTQVGACIVNPERKIVGIGYNGFPIGCCDDDLPWARKADDELNTKYPYVCHAEMNATMNKNTSSLKGCTMYVALFPCNECATDYTERDHPRAVPDDKYHDLALSKLRAASQPRERQLRAIHSKAQVCHTAAHP